MFYVNYQVYAFLCSVAGGMAIALLYDIFRIFRKTVKTGVLAAYIQDLLYWLIVAVIMFMTIYYSNDGELRAYLFLGAFLGVLLYALAFSRIVMESSMLIIRAAAKLFKLIFLIISYPIRLILRVFSAPAKKLAGKAAAFMRKLKRGSKIRASRRAFFIKSLKHIMKKI
ncbi:MAG: spore cortex biosynthesis protein YabQ [Bacillota bacterium]